MTEYTWEVMLEEIEKAIATGRVFPIAPEDRLYLSSYREPKGQHFAELFRHVWHGIPKDVRLAIVDFWKQHASFGKPMIEYSNLWAPKDRGVRATTSAFTGELQFVAKEVDTMPDDAVRFIIAHELAHVFQKARGDAPDVSDAHGYAFIGSDGQRRTVEENERDASQLAESWGFPERPLLLWELKSRGRNRNRT